MLLRTYVQRLRMEAPLRRLSPAVSPPGIVLTRWESDLVDSHAEVKWLAFRDTVDAAIFPNLGRLDGCIQLMRSIAAHPGFLPQATWLARGPEGFCGCVQGVRNARRTGMIQNLGVVPECRGHGVGKALLAAALQGFRDAGLTTAQLEVSARNAHALRLYQAAGFVVRKCFYRETRAEYTEYAI
jgi:ribosomal protein S18 acetylase RimI-like enzyme